MIMLMDFAFLSFTSAGSSKIGSWQLFLSSIAAWGSSSMIGELNMGTGAVLARFSCFLLGLIDGAVPPEGRLCKGLWLEELRFGAPGAAGSEVRVRPSLEDADLRGELERVGELLYRRDIGDADRWPESYRRGLDGVSIAGT